MAAEQDIKVVAGREWATTATILDLWPGVVTRDNLYDWRRRKLVTPVRIGLLLWWPLDQLAEVDHRTRTRPTGRKRTTA